MKRKHRWSLLWAARFVASWEGFLPRAYLDTIASPPVLTIGYGHTGPITVDGKTRPIRAGDVITKRDAKRLLAADLRDASKAVSRAVYIHLSVRQRIALISFVFNLGPGVLSGDFLRDLNAGRYRKTADRMLEYDHAGGVVVQGLLNRRKAERWMFLHSRQH